MSVYVLAPGPLGTALHGLEQHMCSPGGKYAYPTHDKVTPGRLRKLRARMIKWYNEVSARLLVVWLMEMHHHTRLNLALRFLLDTQ